MSALPRSLPLAVLTLALGGLGCNDPIERTPIGGEDAMGGAPSPGGADAAGGRLADQGPAGGADVGSNDAAPSGGTDAAGGESSADAGGGVVDAAPADADASDGMAATDAAGGAADATPDQGFVPMPGDMDGDGVLDEVDGCPTLPDPDQLDTDGDAIGDACECDGVYCGEPDDCESAPYCEVETGNCIISQAPDGEVCDDDDPCSLTSICEQGSCVARQLKPCDDPRPCHTDPVCNPGSGECEDSPLEEGTLCEDGDVCTHREACTAGACVGEALDPCEGTLEGTVLEQGAYGPGVVAGARVSVVGGPGQFSTPAGDFSLDAVPAGERVLVRVRGPFDDRDSTWGDVILPLSIRPGERTRLQPHLLRGCLENVRMAQGELSAEVFCQLDRGQVTATFIGAQLQFTDGRPFNGAAVRVDLVPLLVPTDDFGTPDLSDFFGLPGDMRGLDADGAEVRLEGLAAVQVRARDAATLSELALAPGSTVELRLEGLPFDAAATTWRLGLDDGFWHATPDVAIAPDDPDPALSAEAVTRVSAPSFGWWNVQRPASEPTCVRVAVSEDGEPAAGAVVQARGEASGIRAFGTVADDGTACLDVPAETYLQVEAGALGAVGALRAVAQVETFAPGLTCSAQRSQCPVVTTLELAPAWPACWVGRATYQGAGGASRPIPAGRSLEVRTSRFGLRGGALAPVAFVADDGTFCLQGPVDADAFEFVDRVAPLLTGDVGVSQVFTVVPPDGEGSCDRVEDLALCGQLDDVLLVPGTPLE